MDKAFYKLPFKNFAKVTGEKEVPESAIGSAMWTIIPNVTNSIAYMTLSDIVSVFLKTR